jgi:thiazole synthase
MTKETGTVTVSLNGQERAFAAGGSVADVLEELGLHPQLVVVEYNREILPRERLAEVEVRQGDQLEIVHFVGGG